MRKPLHILVADDDEDDRYLIRHAFHALASHVFLHFVEHGAALIKRLEDLYHQSQPMPSLILLDLNMPVMDGKEALQFIKKHHIFKSIPVIIFSTTSNQHDIAFSYEAGANTFITKPHTYTSLENMAKAIYDYWFSLATLKIQ